MTTSKSPAAAATSGPVVVAAEPPVERPYLLRVDMDLGATHEFARRELDFAFERARAVGYRPSSFQMQQLKMAEERYQKAAKRCLVEPAR